MDGRRGRVVLAAKCGLVWHTQKGNSFFDHEGDPVHSASRPDSISHEVEQSLRRLHTDRIDHYINHWQDPTTPIDETMEALKTPKRQGRGRSGASPSHFARCGTQVSREQVTCPRSCCATPGDVERDLSKLWKNAGTAIRASIAAAGVEPGQIAAVGCAGHGNGLYLIDAAGKPLIGIQSLDARAAGLAAELAEARGAELQAVCLQEPRRCWHGSGATGRRSISVPRRRCSARTSSATN